METEVKGSILAIAGPGLTRRTQTWADHRPPRVDFVRLLAAGEYIYAGMFKTSTRRGIWKVVASLNGCWTQSKIGGVVIRWGLLMETERKNSHRSDASIDGAEPDIKERSHSQ
jgi:hypothetical protein